MKNYEKIHHGGYLVTASELGREYKGIIDLDNGIPFDIYELFCEVTNRDYNHESHGDELLILDIALAFEEARK